MIPSAGFPGGFPSEFSTIITINNQCSVPIMVNFYTAGSAVLAKPGVHTYTVSGRTYLGLPGGHPYNVFFLPAPPLPYQLIYENQIIGMGVLTSSTLTISNCPTLVSSSPSSPTSTPAPSATLIALGVLGVIGVGVGVAYLVKRRRS